MPFISFCLSTYKRKEILKKTLESIQMQNFDDYEVIISDNDVEGSAGTVVQQMSDPRFKYFPNRENLGMIKSFNLSIERACGEYVTMLADDDPIYFDHASTLVELSKNYPGYGMYMGGCDWFCTDTQIAKLNNLDIGTNSCLSNEYNLNYIRTYTADEFQKSFFSFRIFRHCLWSTCMVRKDILIEKGGLPDYGTPFLGDYAYLPIMASHSGCVVINRSLGCQAVHPENFGRSQHDQIITAVKEYPKYVGEKLKHLQSWQTIKKAMLDFVGLWVVTHLTFLNIYSKNLKDHSLRDVEKEIFKIGFMKKYKLKYNLKKHTPFLHNQLVSLKRRIARQKIKA